MGVDSSQFCLDPNAKGTRVKPEDVLIGFDGERYSVLDFWRWAFSDMCDDALKGEFAEWLVGLLLGIHRERRVYWANTDLVSKTEVRVEVKSSSYWQSWRLWDNVKPRSVSVGETEKRKIRFAGLKVRDKADSPPEYHSDLYVFAFQAERDPRLWNALDLRQWEFYMLTRAEMKTIGASSVSLHTLREKAGAAMTASQLQDRGRKKIADLSEDTASLAAGAGG